jgi:hypothetical protein
VTTTEASEPTPQSDIMRALRDAMQTVKNIATPLWYGTEETVERGKMLVCKGNEEFGSPPFVICHPDDVGLLPQGARHLREYRPTLADLRKHRPLAYEPRDEPFTLRWRL